MCGIIGLFPFGKLDAKQEKVRQEVMMYLSTELLQITQTRGKDATGVSVMFENCDYIGLKMGISAVEFVARFGGKETDFEGFMKIWRKKMVPAKAFLGHCRKPTAGKSTIDNINNHPIKVGDIIGIHNGTLDNHETIFKNLERKPNGEVDSEAIFQLLHYLTNNGTDPFTLNILEETCKRLEGSYACLAFNGNNPFQVVAFRDSRPIEIAVLKPLKLVIVASDSDFIKTALFRLNIMANIYNYGINFPTIHKNDVDMELLTDDSVYLFDLTKEIDMNTTVADTYESKRVIRIEKIWKNKKDSYGNYYNQYNQNRTTNNIQKKAEVVANSAELPNKNSEKSDEKNIYVPKNSNINKTNFEKALVWNKLSESFEKTDISLLINEEIVNTLPNMIVNIETDSVITADKEIIRSPKKNDDDTSLITDEKNNNFPIKEVQSSPSKEDQLDKAVKIEVVKTIPINLTKIDKDGKEIFQKELIPIKQIDMITSTPVAIELAVKAANSAERFSTDDDVCQALNIFNCNNLNSLPVYSLANRIIKYITEKAFLVGWKTALQEATPLNILHGKQEKAEQGIRTSKILINFISRIISTKNVQLFDDDKFNDRMFQENDKVLQENRKLSLKAMHKVFSIQDFKQNKILEQIQTLFINEEKKIKKEIIGG